jgi:hypothetical protein
MNELYIGNGDIAMNQTEVVVLGGLGFAHGKVGLRDPLTSPEEMSEFARRQSEHILPITKANTADCGDERLTISLADGTTDPSLLRQRIVPQLFGGLGLATTKAMLAADALAVKDSKNVWEAYLIVSDFLLNSLGEEDAGHAECGASLAVEASVANPIERSLLIPTVALLVPDDGGNEMLIDKNTATKRARLESGFYGGWNPDNHQDYLTSKFPQNFSYLKTDPNDHETHGHNGRGMLVINEEGYGYQKTGEAFAMTLPKARDLAHKLGVNDEERRRILLGFADDAAHIAAGIVSEGFPVFSQVA